jgi:hypothetical protein
MPTNLVAQIVNTIYSGHPAANSTRPDNSANRLLCMGLFLKKILGPPLGVLGTM